jgi:hypothetical protein
MEMITPKATVAACLEGRKRLIDFRILSPYSSMLDQVESSLAVWIEGDIMRVCANFHQFFWPIDGGRENNISTRPMENNPIRYTEYW